MENNEIKKNNNIIIIAFALIIIILVCVIAYLLLKDNKGSNNNNTNNNVVNNQVDASNNNEMALNFEQFEWLMESEAIASYVKSGSKDLVSYLTNNLSNDKKLILGGIKDGIAFSDIQNKLNTYLGSNLDVEAKDYYLPSCPNSSFYIIKNGIYSYNSALDCGAGGTSETLLYLYKQKEVVNTEKGLEVTYYSLFETANGIGPSVYDGKSGCLNCSGEEEPNMDYEFYNNKNNFFEITYIFEKTNDSYKLTNVKKK